MSGQDTSEVSTHADPERAAEHSVFLKKLVIRAGKFSAACIGQVDAFYDQAQPARHIDASLQVDLLAAVPVFVLVGLVRV